MSSKTLDDLQYCDEYMEFIMTNGERMICDGDMLLDAAEDGYLFEEFLASIGVAHE